MLNRVIHMGLFLLLMGISFSGYAFSFPFFHTRFPAAPVKNTAEAHTILARAPDLNPYVLNLALEAYSKLHNSGYDEQQMLTIVDYSKPSTDPRLWVINLKTLEVPFHELVAHGKNSGGNIPSAFSNDPHSLASSIGVFLTADTYIGKHGYSLRLHGLEPGFNSSAYAREIVVHAANYVSHTFARLHGQLGQSWGCFAVNPAVSRAVINHIKNGTVLFAYYPDSHWLTHSAYIRT